MDMNRNRVIIHVDMNAYYASIEQRGNPLLRGKPVLVVADSRRRSVIMTASYEARAFGVKTGMNLYEGRKLCPQAVVVDGNTDKYLYYTSRILEVLESFSDQVEMFSCDEAFLDVTASLHCFGTDGEGMGKMVKDRVKAVTGLPCSVGVAPNKLLAKLASEMHKPDGLTVISPDKVEQVLAETPIEELCGIGGSLKAKLNQLGIKTCKELGEASLSFMQHHFHFWGYWLKRMGRGMDDSPVKRLTDQEVVKSMGHSTTFPRDTTDMDVLGSYLLLLSERVAVRLREGHFQGRTISLYVRYKDFTSFSRQKAIQELVDDGYRIYSVAIGILELIRPFPMPIRLLGVSVSSLVRSQWQEFLFEAMGKRRKVNETVDQVNKRFGNFTVRPAGFIPAERFGILEAPIPPSQHKFKPPASVGVDELHRS